MAPPNLKSSDYYEILGCRKGDDDAALKKAYRKLAVKVRDCINEVVTIVMNPGLIENVGVFLNVEAFIIDSMN